MCIYVYIYIHICIYIYMHIYICIYTYMHIYIYAHIYIYVYVYIFIHIYVNLTCHMYTYICVHMCLYRHLARGDPRRDSESRDSSHELQESVVRRAENGCVSFCNVSMAIFSSFVRASVVTNSRRLFCVFVCLFSASSVCLFSSV